MTYGDATAAKSQGDCLAQNNLDYLDQYFNGWLQDKPANNLGSYREYARIRLVVITDDIRQFG